ncbi:hypothetical protein L218DRAFT_887825 [Marasmius fiardii PR-910]|nr:hypothetical protein L218DRAFT_887825 [Marasmius fiardii PR-910]
MVQSLNLNSSGLGLPTLDPTSLRNLLASSKNGTADFNVNAYSVIFTAVIGFLAWKQVDAYHTRAKLDGIPTVGRNGVFSSYISAWEYYKDGRGIVEEGCRKVSN